MKKFLSVFFSIALCACVLLTGTACGGGGLQEVWEDNDEFYTITWFMPITTDGIATTFADMDEVEDAVNEIIRPKINAEVNIVELLWFDYNTQMTNRIGSGEKFDLCFTSPNINYYWTNIERQAFLPLDSLLEMYAPNILAQVPDYIMGQATASDGKIYGVVNQQILPRTDAVLIRDYDYLNQFLAQSEDYKGYDYTNIYEYILEQELHPYDILEEYVSWLKQNNLGEGGKMGALDVTDNLQTRYHWDDLGTGMQVPGVVACEDSAEDGLVVFNQFETEEFKNDIQRKAGHYTSGLSPNTINSGDYGTDMSAYDVASLTTWKPNDIRTNEDGKKGGALRLGNPYYYISYILGTMTAISSTSENPARVMKFLDLMWTDSDIMNLLCFGIEGEHYNYTGKDDCQITMIPNSGYDNATMTWAYATEFVEGLNYLSVYEENPYKQSQQVNESAFASDVIGFNFDESNVSVEISQCKAIASTYLREFATGVHGNNVMEKYDEFIQQMKTAGMEKIIAEKQSQINEWLAAHS